MRKAKEALRLGSNCAWAATALGQQLRLGSNCAWAAKESKEGKTTTVRIIYLSPNPFFSFCSLCSFCFPKDSVTFSRIAFQSMLLLSYGSARFRAFHHHQEGNRTDEKRSSSLPARSVVVGGRVFASLASGAGVN
jgi:hypothetical protein